MSDVAPQAGASATGRSLIPCRPARVGLATFLFCAGLAVGGGAEPASIRGGVRAADGSGVPQLPLTLRGELGSFRAITGADGEFELDGLPDGEYAVAVAVPGFDLDPPSVRVDGSQARWELTLRPSVVTERVLVSASRHAAPASTIGVSATVVDSERIGERGSSDLLHLLQEAPGIAVARAGGLGNQASAFVRGGESDFARVLIDGIAVNEPGGSYDLGTQVPLELERVEMLRGSASTLYGTDALAGVVQMVTRRARAGEAPSLRAEAEAGTSEWQRLLAGTTGRAARLDWNAGAQWLKTDNDQPNNRYEQAAGALSAGMQISERTRLGLVLRATSSEVGTPGQTAFGRPDLDASSERGELVAGLRFSHAAGRVLHQLSAGHARSDQLSTNPDDSGSWLPRFAGQAGPFELSDFTNPEGFQNDTERSSLSYQAEISLGAHLFTAGLDLEHEAGAVGDRRGELLRPVRTNLGGFAQARLLLGERWFATLGGRVEDNGSFGTEAVPRASLAWQASRGVAPTTLRASAGLGIKEPSFFESFGASFFAQGNPDLAPERSRTFDLGVEQLLFDGQLALDAAVFHHDYRDQIAYQVVDLTTFEGSYVNLGRTRARGLELTLRAAPVEGLRLRGHYTFLDGEVVDSASAFDPVFAEGQSLLRRPRHQGALGADYARGRWALGADLFLVGERADSDFVGLGLTRTRGYGRLDARGRVDLARRLVLFVVGENLLGEDYMEVLGYPAPGRSLRVGLRLDTRR